MPARRPRRLLSLVVALGLIQGCQVFPGMTGPQEEGTVVFSQGKLLLGSRFIGLKSADGQPIGEISVQVGGKIYKSRNGKLLLPEYALQEAQRDGLVVLVPGYLPRKVHLDDPSELPLTPVHAPKIHAAVGAEGGTFASGDGTATVTLPPGFLKSPPASIAVSTYTPPLDSRQQSAFDAARQAFLSALGLSADCDMPLPCGPLVNSLGLLLTVDGSVKPAKLPVSFDLTAMLRGWNGQGAGPWEASPGDWSQIQIAQARAASAIAKTLDTLARPEYASARAALESQFGIAWSGRTLTFTITLGDSQIIDGLARVEVEGFDLLGARVEVTVVSSVSESLPPAASQPGLSGNPPTSASGPNGASGPSGIIAAGGGNIIAPGGGNIIAAGGGNIIAAGGGNIIAAGGGNVIATGGGNIIAAGGGNIIAAGGGNFVNSGGALTGTVRMPQAPMVAKYSSGGRSAYGVLAFSDFAWPSPEVRLVDLLGTPITDWITASSDGTYRLTDLPQTPQAVFVEARGGKRLVRTIAPAPGDKTVTADLDAATTALTGYLIEELKSGSVATIDMVKFAADLKAVRDAMSQADAERVTADPADPATARSLILKLMATTSLPIESLVTPSVSTVSITDGTTFNQPAATAVAPDGSLYMADSLNHTIVKINADGSVSTVAGNGRPGSSDGLGMSARFNSPSGLAVDGGGNLYVADTFNHRIRRITPDGTVSTVAGSIRGFTDGAAASAKFDAPTGLAIDGAGNLFVADKANHRIRKITPGGTVSTVAGVSSGGYTDGSFARAQFNEPTGVAVDATGNVYVADSGNACIRKIDSSSQITTLIGGSVPLPSGIGSGFSKPWSLAIDQAGYLYVADFSAQRLFVAGPDGAIAALAGTGSTGATEGSGTSATFNGPMGISMAAEGVFYVADRDGNRVRKLSVPADWVTTQLAPPTVGIAGAAAIQPPPELSAEPPEPGG